MDIEQPRLRVFAGPNGSGKSTIIDFIRKYKVNGKSVEFGFYINADEIASLLTTEQGYSFKQYNFIATNSEFNQIVLESGLIDDSFTIDQLVQTYVIVDNSIHCIRQQETERLAQMKADFLRKKLLRVC